MSRHDSFLKALYRAGARDAIALFYLDLAQCIQWDELRWVDKEVPILGSQPRSIVSDLVAVTRDSDGQGIEVLIHPEIQMRDQADMGWRVLQYNAGLTLQQANPNTRVLTFVFYHCKGTGGIRAQRHRLEFAGFTTLEVGYWGVGSGDLCAEEYAAQDNPMAWALASWMRQQRPERAVLRLRLMDRILRSVGDEHYRWLLLDAVQSYFRLSVKEQAQEAELLRVSEFGEVREMYDAVLGRREERTRRDTLQQALLAVVRSRFPSAPEDVEAHIRRLRSLEKLDHLIRRAATADSIDEILPALAH